MYLANISNTDATTDDEIWTAPFPRTGSGFKQLTNNQDREWAPIWSPDGSKIAFGKSDATDVDVYTMSATGGTATPVISNQVDDFVSDWGQRPR